MAKNGNYAAVISALDEEGYSSQDMVNMLTQLGVNYDTAIEETKSYYGSGAESNPTTYEDITKATGKSDIFTEGEFYRHRNAVNQYGDYQSYLDAMYKQYKK